MPSNHVQKTIQAPPDRIWAILTDTAALQAADTGITRLEGQIAKGGKLRLWADVAGDRAFDIAVTQFDPPHRMVWENGLPLRLFWGRRTFTLTPSGGATIFEMTEVYTGLLTPLMMRVMPDLQPSFHQFANALATLAEEA